MSNRESHSGGVITRDHLDSLREKWTPSVPIIVGIACSPACEAALRRECAPTGFPGSELCAIPILVDRRLESNKAQVYRSAALWSMRCDEQKLYEEMNP